MGAEIAGQERALQTELRGVAERRESSQRELQRRECVARLQELYPDVRGLLLDLCAPSLQKWGLAERVRDRYNGAVNVALGKHLDAVVVNTKQVAIECVQ